MQGYDIDYVVKTDTDTVPLFDKYFQYVNDNLPPDTNASLLAGNSVTKVLWKIKDPNAENEWWSRRKFPAHVSGTYFQRHWPHPQLRMLLQERRIIRAWSMWKTTTFPH